MSPYKKCYSIDGEIRFHGDVILQPNENWRAWESLVSPAKKHFAFWMKSRKGRGVPDRLLAVTEGMECPVLVGEGHQPRHCFAWIEDTTALRAAEASNASSAEGSAP